jgi:hypothetical protein
MAPIHRVSLREDFHAAGLGRNVQGITRPETEYGALGCLVDIGMSHYRGIDAERVAEQ